jgi:hypothetical protein
LPSEIETLLIGFLADGEYDIGSATIYQFYGEVEYIPVPDIPHRAGVILRYILPI